MLLAGLIGLLVAILTRPIRATRAQRLHDPLAAIVAAVIASVGSAWLVGASPTIVVLGGLMLMLPGYAFTVLSTNLQRGIWWLAQPDSVGCVNLASGRRVETALCVLSSTWQTSNSFTEKGVT